MTTMMRVAAMAMIRVVVVNADAGADMQAADVNARTDFGGCCCCAEQAQGKNGDEQFFHDNSLW
jgi:hypothetical protein